MANCMATCEGFDKNRIKEDHRLGSESAKGTASTWSTDATAFVRKDGSGYVRVSRHQSGAIHYFEFGPENEPPTRDV